MSAFLSKLMKVEVKGGDAIANNRLSGKSNTGTYFLCSLKDWEKFNEFVPDEGGVSYYLDLKKVESYKHLFLQFFLKDKDKYPDRMSNFVPYCDSLCCYVKNPLLEFTTRKNDNRVFLKFVNNLKSDVEKQFRDILYADLSCIVFELISPTVCMIYPEVNYNCVAKEEYNEY